MARARAKFEGKRLCEIGAKGQKGKRTKGQNSKTAKGQKGKRARARARANSERGKLRKVLLSEIRRL